MEYEKLKAAAETIVMPAEMKHHIAKNCKTHFSNSRKEISMNANNTRTFFQKPAVCLTALVICLSLAVTALAATDTLTGFFRDIQNGYGTIVGTSYEQATAEIHMEVTASSKELIVQAAFADPQMIPYADSEYLGIAEYRIVDENNKVMKEGAAESAEVINGQAAIHIPLDDIGSGSYRLVVTAFVSEKKADQPLNLNGTWESSFTK